MYKNNTIEWDLYNIYSNYWKEYNNIYSSIKFKTDSAHWYIYIDIEDVLTEENTWLEFISAYFWPLHLLWNINWNIGNGLYWKSEDIKNHFLSIARQYLSLLENKENSLNLIEEKYWKKDYNRASHAVISHNARN